MNDPMIRASAASGLATGGQYRLLGIMVAICWPVFTVLPEDRFGGIFMLNAIAYTSLFILTVALLPRRGLVSLTAIAILFCAVIFIPAATQAIYLGNDFGSAKAIDVFVTHLVFMFAGIVAARNFDLFAKYFFGSLLAFILINLAIELYPDFTIESREKIGFFGGQGFSRVLCLTAVGYIVTLRLPGFLGSKVGPAIIFAMTAGLSIFAGARSSLLGLVIALTLYYLTVRRKLVPFLVLLFFMLILAGLLIWNFYLTPIRPMLIELRQASGLVRTLLTLDIFFIDAVGTDRIASVMERFVLWQEGIRIAYEFPLGVGLGGFERLVDIGQEKTPHNVILEIIVEMGCFLGAVYIAFIVILIFRSDRQILPYLTILAVLFMFSGNLVDMRQLIFFLGVTLYQLFCTPSQHRPVVRTHDSASIK